MSTVKASDLYPGFASTPKNDPSSLQAASGRVGNETNPPVYVWLGMVGLLVAFRLVYELAPAGQRIG